MPYRLLHQFRSLFDGEAYRHRNSTLGDSVAAFLPDDLYAIGRSTKLARRVEAGERVVNVQNRLRGVKARRGDGTFGEIIPNTLPLNAPEYLVARGNIATVEVGVEVKILAKAMIKQIDRVINDLDKQVEHFRRGGGNPICVAIVGINSADHYVSFEKDRTYPTDGKTYQHPIQEAAKAETRLLAEVARAYDEFVILRFRATNERPFTFGWVDEAGTNLDYGAALTRIVRRYDDRF